MKPDLLILSDLWGFEKADWVNYYAKALQAHFNVSFVDCRKLARLDCNKVTESEIHAQFLEFGIQNVVSYLLKTKINESLNILAFSIGGTIAWKAALAGLKAKNMYLLSSTRLRYEVKKPNCNIFLYYGENDAYQPNADWFKKMDLDCKMSSNAAHEFYRTKKTADTICDRILQEYNLH